MSKIATRDGFGDEIVELGRENKNILVVDVDIGKSCKTTNFAKQLPAQHVNVGIAEQSGAGVAAGLATCGKIPFVVTYAAFGSMRMCEMIRQEICYPHLNVKIACSHGGVTPANDGASHQCIEDMGILSTIPGMTVIMPADYNAARKLRVSPLYARCRSRGLRSRAGICHRQGDHSARGNRCGNHFNRRYGSHCS